MTSPPYFGLRDYGVNGQIGLEQSPEEYVNKLVSVFREVRRVLRNDGTLWLNLGDSYAKAGISGMGDPTIGTQNLGGMKPIKKAVPFGLKPKDLVGIPWRMAFALQADGWYLRSDIIWSKPNPMPESVRDRPTKSHEYIFLLSKQPRYFFDSEVIAEPVADSTIQRLSQDIEHQEGSKRVPGKTNGNMKAVAPRYAGKKYTENPDLFYRTKSGNAYNFRERRNKRDVWTVSTKPFKGAHFAVFPPDLVKPCILAGCPEGGIVLDPFGGSGTVAMVAAQYGRDSIYIDLNPEYAEMAKQRAAILF